MSASTNLDDLASALQTASDEVKSLRGLLDGWQRSGNSYPHFDYLNASWGEFVYPPFESAGFKTNSTMAVSSGVWTTVVFDEVEWNTGVIGYSTATGLFTFPRPPDKRIYLVQGRAEYNLIVGTYHAIEITSYPSTVDVIMSKMNKLSMIQTFFYLYQPPAGSSGFSIQVSEDGPNPLTRASFSMWEVGRK